MHYDEGEYMGMLTVRNVPDDVHQALKMRAALHGRSTEAEVRDILATVVKPPNRLRMGDALADVGRLTRLNDQEVAAFDAVRDKTPAAPMRFE